MATADVSEKTENEVEAVAPMIEPSLSWDESVAFRPIGIGWDSEVVVLDWDGEGTSVLLVIASEGRAARLYRPGAEGAFPRPFDAGTLVEGLDGLRSLCVLPNGSASRFDLVGLSAEGLVLLKNEGTADQPRFEDRESLGLPADLGLEGCRVAQLSAVDWDGDGKVDLLVGLDNLEGYWPDEANVPIEQEVGFNQKGGHPGYDRNGLWRGRAPVGKIRWLRNIGEPGTPRFELEAELATDSGHLDLAIHPAPLAVSWYGGDNLELLLSDVRGLVKIYRNFGGQRPPVLMEPRTLKAANAPLILPEDRTTLIAADLDGDRRTELICGSSDGRVFAVRATSRDVASIPHELLQEAGPLWLGGHAVVATGDLDADGGLDLVFGDGPGHLWLMKDLGQRDEHRYALPIPIEAGGVRFRLDPGPDGRLGGPIASRLGHACPILADWTGNGRLDVLVGGAGGEVLFLRNDGAANHPRFASPVALRCEGAPLILPPRVRPGVADWNGTGALDLIALDLQGFLCVYPVRDEKNVGAPVPLVDRLGRVIRLDGGFGLGGKCSVWAGAWTAPGRVDLLIGLPADSAQFILPALTGRAWPEDGAWPTVLLLENQGRNGLIARPIATLDGQPLVIGVDGCSPSGVAGRDPGLPDLLVGSDDGHVHYYRRDQLRW
jgi:hypothetical protein